MKIRFDFVTNSSSSSFVCIQFKSKKLKELLTKYDVQYWKSNSEWDVYYKDEDAFCNAEIQNSVKGALDWFMEDLLLLMNSGNGFIGEYRSNRQIILLSTIVTAGCVLTMIMNIGIRNALNSTNGITGKSLAIMSIL